MNWIKIEDMEDDPYEGWCWIFYKGRVTEAFRDSLYNYAYRFHRCSQGVFMTECITHVMKMPLPEPPAANNEVTANKVGDNKYEAVIIKGGTPGEDVTLRVSEDSEYDASEPDYKFTP